MVAGEQRLRAAARYYDERINGLTTDLAPEIVAERLMELQRRIISGLRFLVYEGQTDAEVGVVFETLNERGRPLTELEKVKNYLLYLARQLPETQMSDLADTINGAWSHIFQMLALRPASFEERLLRAHWIATMEPDARQWKRIASVKPKFPRSKYVPGSERLGDPAEDDLTDEDAASLLYQEVKSYVEGLRASATYIAEMYNDEAAYHAFPSKQHEIRSATAALQRSPVVAIFQPVILCFRLAHPEDADAYLRLIQLCETYSARVFAICQRRSNAEEPYLAGIAHDVYSGGATPDEALTRIAALLWEYAPEDDVERNLLGKTNWYARAAHKYFLYEYERSFAKSDSDVVKWTDIVDAKTRKTTEHILPQTPSPGSEWLQAFTEDERDELTHTLGNLVLTYDNSVYSNKDYDDKRGAPGQQTTKCYFTASLRSEVDIAQRYEQWNREAMIDRQERIADWALKRWHVDPPRRADIQALEDELGEEAENPTEEEDIPEIG